VEASGIFNWREGDVRGVQGSGIFNRATSVEGVQASGIFNSTPGPIAGVQIGLVNVGGDVDGTQIGLVNIAGHVRGGQAGLVNVADRVDGVSLAPISILGQNRTRLVAWVDSELPINAGVKYETGPLYSLFTSGVSPESNDTRVGWGLGIGAHIAKPTRSLALDVDLLYRYIVSTNDTTDDRHSTALRGIAEWRLSDGFALFATGGVENRVDTTDHFVPYGGLGLELF
jgi:opacity protein-like surface antigen